MVILQKIGYFNRMSMKSYKNQKTNLDFIKVEKPAVPNYCPRLIKLGENSITYPFTLKSLLQLLKSGHLNSLCNLPCHNPKTITQT